MVRIVLLSVCVILLSVFLYFYIKKKLFVEVQFQLVDKGYINDSSITLQPALLVVNYGELPVYLDCYTFNGSKYPCDRFFAVAHPKHDETLFDICMPVDSTVHVSVSLYFHDIFNRRWTTNLICDKTGTPPSWVGQATTRRALRGETAFFVWR